MKKRKGAFSTRKRRKKMQRFYVNASKVQLKSLGKTEKQIKSAMRVIRRAIRKSTAARK